LKNEENLENFQWRESKSTTKTICNWHFIHSKEEPKK